MALEIIAGLQVNGDQRTQKAIKENNIIVLGDLNLHLINETCLLYKYGFYDCWVEAHPDDKGYTWDPLRNKLINYLLPYDNRRMRLDRIAVK